VGDTIFDIPVLGDVLKATAPEIFALNEGLKLADVGARGMAGLTDLDNYKDQKGEAVVKSILTRAVVSVAEAEAKGAFKDLKFV
jgi:hypothetical protein